MSRGIGQERLFQIITWLVNEAVPVPGRIFFFRQWDRFFILYEPYDRWPGGMNVKKPILGQGSFARGKVEFSTAELSDDVVVESQAIPILAKIFERIGFAQTSNGEGRPTWMSLAALVPEIISEQKLTERVRARVSSFEGTVSFTLGGRGLKIQLASGDQPVTIAQGDDVTFEFLNGPWISDATLKEVIQCAADYVRLNGWRTILPPGLK